MSMDIDLITWLASDNLTDTLSIQSSYQDLIGDTQSHMHIPQKW